MRFSIVLELDDECKDVVLSVQSKFASQFPTVQWLERDQLYLTVKFLGNPLKRFHKDLKKLNLLELLEIMEDLTKLLTLKRSTTISMFISEPL